MAARSAVGKPKGVDRVASEAKLLREAGDAVDAQLARYRSMRNFRTTAEPSGAARKGSAANGLPFVIQKHAATRLHYDFRLGWNGVLKSWAVSKGPSYNVHDRRLAVEVEDHPMEYGGFEGIIPRGQYGGGTVMVWDQGTWEPHVDVDEGLRKGGLKFSLQGTKLQGNWTLVRMGGKAANEAKPNWLLIKEHDEFERGADAPCITDEAPNSAVTGRSLEQIAAAETHVWNSKETASADQAWYRQRARDADAVAGKPAGAESHQRALAKKPQKAADAESVVSTEGSGLVVERMPEFLKPQLAEQVETPPRGAEWLHELKLDGYRMQAYKRGRSVRMLTRTGLDWTHRVKPLTAALTALPVESAILDGEVVVLDERGVSSFARLQASFEKGEQHPLTYFIFDLLHLDGQSTRALPLSRRKELLRSVIGEDSEAVRFSEHLTVDGDAVFRKACELHAEGIISKRMDGIYSSGRGSAWLKSKCLHEQEFVIGGWTDLSNGQRGVGALLLGYYDEAGYLRYAGRTGTGFNATTHRTLRDRLDAVARKTMPFTAVPAIARRGVHWVMPELVAQVRFATWTAEDQLRQAAFLGLREDKPAREVRRENAAPTPKRLRSGRAAEGNRAAEAQAKEAFTVPDAPRSASVKTQRVNLPTMAAMPTIRLTHPQKVVDAVSGVTKQQLAEYLFAVSTQMLPHIADRPLSLVRCPEGAAKPCFYQKHVNHLLPAGVGSVMVADKKGSAPEPYITLNTVEALTGLAQMSVLEIHPWGSRNETLESPDRIIIDLDPDETLPWSQVCESAREVQARLKALKLESFVKTTGGKGLHIVFPLEPGPEFAVMKAWAHGFVAAMERENPQLYLTRMTKAARTGKIYLDYLRNERGATAVAPFSMRARPGLPCSVTLDWKELTGKTRTIYRIDNFASEWCGRLRHDPWKRISSVRQTLSAEVLERFAGKAARRTYDIVSSPNLQFISPRQR